MGMFLTMYVSNGWGHTETERAGCPESGKAVVLKGEQKFCVPLQLSCKFMIT